MLLPDEHWISSRKYLLQAHHPIGTRYSQTLNAKLADKRGRCPLGQSARDFHEDPTLDPLCNVFREDL